MLTFSWTADVLNSDSASLLFSSTELVNYDHVFNIPGTNLKKREKNSEKIKEESVCVFDPRGKDISAFLTHRTVNT